MIKGDTRSLDIAHMKHGEALDGVARLADVKPWYPGNLITIRVPFFLLVYSIKEPNTQKGQKGTTGIPRNLLVPALHWEQFTAGTHTSSAKISWKPA